MKYQVLKTLDRIVYCSSEQFKNHDTAAEWVRKCMLQFNIPARKLHRTHESDSQPPGAVIWP